MAAPKNPALPPEHPGPASRCSVLFRLCFERFEEIVGGAAFVAMTVMVFVNVLCRYLFNSPIPGSDELATLAFTWATFLGASLGIRRQLHLGIEFVTRLFPDRLQAVCELMVSALIGLFAVLLLIYSGQIIRTAHLKLTPVLQWPYTIVYLAIPVGAVLMLLRLAPIVRVQLLSVAGRGRGVREPEAAPL